MASFKFAIGQVNITDYLLVICKSPPPDSTEVARQVFPGPQPANRNIEFDNLDPAVYYFDFRESSDGIDLGTLMATFTVDVKTQNIINERRFYLTGGTGAHDPAIDSDTITDPYLDGKNISGVFKEGFRYLVTPDYTNAEYELISGGGVHLVDGKTFSIDEVAVIEITYTIPSIVSPNSGFPADYILKNADFTFDSTYYNRVVEAAKSGTILTMTMPAVSSMPDGTKFGINTHSGKQRYVAMQLQVGDYCLVGSFQRNIVYVGKGEEVVFHKKGGYLRIVSWPGDWRRVGELVQQESAPLNGIAERGSWQLIADYPRIFYWYVNVLDPAALATGISYPTIPDVGNKTKWIIDIVNGRIWIPDTRGLFNSATNAGQPGIFSNQSIQDHRHWTIIDKQVASSQFPEGRGTQLTPLRSPIRYWSKSGGGAEGYDLDSNTDEPTLGRSGLPITPGTNVVAGGLINSSVTKPASVDRNFYRII